MGVDNLAIGGSHYAEKDGITTGGVDSGENGLIEGGATVAESEALATSGR